ncbi:hypothetical protein LWI28_014976 [Acer negundo]|uniref:CCHC-type domain-containing protein n=1 Tax=Acer negundo TaxID=4023 RepID=A0AAD5JJP8_ACENE|nr:hypothetical protein LWI28_014976 [Acer negundo]
MEQASHNLSSSNPPNEPTQTPINIQQQLDQLSQTLRTILHRLEVIEEHSTAGGGRGVGGDYQFRRPEIRQEPLDELTKRMKVEVADFLGRLDPNAFQDWVIALEGYFDWFSVPEDKKVRFVKVKLKGPARVWWSSVEEQLHRTHQASIVDWEEMKERLEIETETQSLVRYLNRLKTEIRREMLTARVYSVKEAYQLALQLERQATSSYQRRFQPIEFVSTRTTSTPNQKNVDKTVKGIVPEDTRSKAKLVGEGLQCYKCKGFGHFAVVCPARDKRVAYICEKELIAEEEVEPSSVYNA